jgi:transposase
MPRRLNPPLSLDGKHHQVDSITLKKVMKEYRQGVRGSGYRAIAARHHLHWQTVEKIIKRAKRHGGNPVQPRGHRKRKLTATEESKIENFLDKHPFTTNKRLAALVNDKVTPRTISNVLHRSDPPFTPKKSVDQEPEEITAEWKELVSNFINKELRHISIAHRIYEDETPIYANEAPQKGRARRGKKLYRTRKRYSRKYVLHVYAKRTGVIYWELSEKNANDMEIQRIVQNALPFIRKGDVLLWDRLGRSGRARNPKSQHYNPDVLAAIKSKGAKVLFLPPKAKYLNPLELLFNDLKQHYIRPAFHENGTDMERDEIEEIVTQYMAAQAPKCLPGFFRERANGRELKAQELI